MWEFSAAIDGYNKLHGQHKIEPPSEEEFEAALARQDKIFGTVH